MLAEDNQPPIVESISIDKKDVTVGDTVTITAIISDASKIKDVRLNFKNNNAFLPSVINNYLTSDDNHTFKLSFTITDNFINGTYKLSYLVASDALSNETYANIGNDIYFSVSEARNDNNPPVVESISIDKKDVTVGDTVTITAIISDASKIKDVRLNFKNNNAFLPSVINNYLTSDDNHTFKLSFTITDNFINGIYKLSYFVASDALGNETYANIGNDIYFSVSEARNDNNPPVVESISIDKKDVTVGDTVTITAIISDASKIKDVRLNFKNNNAFLPSVINNYLTSDDNHTFKLSFTITDNFINGIYKLSYFVASDALGNETYANIGNDIYFTVLPSKYISIPSMVGNKVVNENITISNQTINGDIYIAPNKTVYLDNVTVNGDIYVLGVLHARSINAHNIYAHSISYGSWAYSNGEMSISGNNSIQSLTASTYPIQDIPLQLIDNQLKSVDGKISFSGTTLDLYPTYVNNQLIKTVSGKFIVNDLNIGNADELNFQWTTNFGNTISKTIAIDKYKTSNGQLVKLPKLSEVGWKKDATGKWYLNADGSYPKNAWKLIDGNWYYFDDHGYMVHDKWIGNYYLKSNGQMAKNEWIGDFYVDQSGKWIPNKVKFVEEWKENSTGKWYQLADGSYPKKVWKLIDGSWYYFDEHGYMVHDKWIGNYYLKSNGQMAKNEWIGKFYVDQNGVWVPGKFIEEWKENSTGKWYQLEDGSYPKNAWKYIDGSRYFFDEHGYMVHDKWIGNYYLKSNGQMAKNEWIGKFYVDQNGVWVPGKFIEEWKENSTGRWYQLEDGSYPKNAWKYIDGSRYFFDEHGYMVHDKWIGNYYLKSNGQMAKNEWIGKFYVDQNGVWVPGKFIEEWKENSIGKWYQLEDGSYPKNAWKFIDDSWYYFNEYGYMVHDKWIGNYYLKSNGQMAKNEWIGKFYVDQNGAWVPSMKT
ncbi:hypothetical protein V4S38_10260 [Enterococcus cecorum]